jgi:aspartate-semialdehyde dehydrogenase
MNEERLRKSPNIAIVGSTSLLGKELQAMLEDRGFPMGRLALLETEEYAGLLQEFAGEIQITQVISPDVFEDIDIAFFTCSPEIMHAYVASGAKFPELTIDLTQAGRAGTIYLEGISNPRLLRPNGYFVNPHPAAIVIARTLSSLHTKFGVQSAAVTVLQPASERGNAGVDELQSQTVNLLNFQEIEHTVFEGQLAFNVLPEAVASEQTENRILEQLVGILGDTFPKPVVTAVQVPVFHSHAFSLFIYLLDTPSIDQLMTHLNQPGITTEVPPGGSSPVGVVGTEAIHVGRIRQDANHAGAYSLWLVADNMRVAASNAIQTAEHIMFAPALEM